MPEPASFRQWLIGQLGSTSADDALDLVSQVSRPQVEVHPVLAQLALRHLLQEQLRAVLGRREQGEVPLGGFTLWRVAEDLRPEARRSDEVFTVDDDDDFSMRVRLH